jgi:hypothetical protein
MAFGPPFYLQWTMQFIPSGDADSGAWPTTWMMPLEFFIGTASTFVEIDGFEYYLGGSSEMNVHYWTSAGSSGGCGGSISPGITDSNFHTYGMLWIPANGATNGVIKRYLDGVDETSVDCTYASGSEGAASDTHHQMLMVAPGDVLAVQWGYIGIWGASASQVITN